MDITTNRSKVLHSLVQHPGCVSDQRPDLEHASLVVQLLHQTAHCALVTVNLNLKLTTTERGEEGEGSDDRGVYRYMYMYVKVQEVW